MVVLFLWRHSRYLVVFLLKECRAVADGFVWSLWYAEPPRVVPLVLCCRAPSGLGPIPAELGGLTALKILDLASNQLSGERFQQLRTIALRWRDVPRLFVR